MGTGIISTRQMERAAKQMGNAGFPTIQQASKSITTAAKKMPRVVGLFPLKLEKQCASCPRKLPATEEYFYTDYKGSLMSNCKKCHSRQASIRRLKAMPEDKVITCPNCKEMQTKASIGRYGARKPKKKCIYCEYEFIKSIPGQKVCSECDEPLGTNDFYKKEDARCKECMKKASNKYKMSQFHEKDKVTCKSCGHEQSRNGVKSRTKKREFCFKCEGKL